MNKHSLLFFLLIVQNIFAQTPSGAGKSFGKLPDMGHLYGKVLDAHTKQPAGFSTVVLLKLNKDSIIAGCLVKENGDFSIDNLPFGQYRLQVGFIGYKKYEQKVTINMQVLEEDLGNILLSPDVTSLKEVVIEGEKGSLQMNIDHKVYNVEKDISTRGGTGLDAVKNIPGVTVDADGNASLRNNNVQIYIDGRPSTLTLQQLPADQIDNVEVITNPSAKYDASTTGGILNLVLKKNTKPGYNGILMGGIGTNDRYNGMGSLNIKEGKFNFFSMYNYNTQTNNNDGFTNRNTLVAVPPDMLSGSVIKYYNQTDVNRLKNTFTTGRLGFDYAIDNRNKITLSGNIVHGAFGSSDNQKYVNEDVNNQIISSGNRTNDRQTQFTNLSGQLQYKRTYPKKGKEFTSDFTFSDNQVETNYLYTTYGYDKNGIQYPNSPSYQKNNGTTPSWQYTYQTDYVNPINDSTKIETGVKSFFNRSSTKSETFNYSTTSNEYVVFPDLTNDYSITSMTNAAYINYSSRFRGSIYYQGGLRFEQSDYQGKITNKNLMFSYSYPSSWSTLQYSLFPAVYFSKKFKHNQEIQLNFSRKINRPNFFQLMPYILYADNMNITIGNPKLSPEFHNLAELNYSIIYDKINFLASGYTRYIQNPITNISYPEANNPNILVSTFQNGSNSFVYGTDNTLKLTLFSKLDITLNSNIFYTNITWTGQGQQYTNHGYSSVEKTGISYKFPASFILQVNGSYQAPQILPQGNTREVKYLDITFTKTIMHFMTATLLLSDAFNSKRMGTDYITPDYIQSMSRRRETRYLKFTLAIMFGKMDASLFKRLKQKPQQGTTPDNMDF